MDLRDPKIIPEQTRWVARYLAKHGMRGVTSNGFGYNDDGNPKWGSAGYRPSGTTAPTAPLSPEVAPQTPYHPPVVKVPDQWLNRPQYDYSKPGHPIIVPPTTPHAAAPPTPQTRPWAAPAAANRTTISLPMATGNRPKIHSMSRCRAILALR